MFQALHSSKTLSLISQTILYVPATHSTLYCNVQSDLYSNSNPVRVEMTVWELIHSDNYLLNTCFSCYLYIEEYYVDNSTHGVNQHKFNQHIMSLYYSLTKHNSAKFS